MTFVKKTAPGSLSTETVVGAAAVELKKVVTAATEAVNLIGSLGEKADDLTLQITNKTNSLDALDVQFKEKERQLTVDLDLAMREKAVQKTAEFLDAQGKTSISKDELAKLRQDFTALQGSYKGDLATAAGAIRTEEQTKWTGEKKLLEAENKQTGAENTYKIQSLEAQLLASKDQIKLLTDQLNAEREAGIKRAQASQVGAINIAPGGK